MSFYRYEAVDRSGKIVMGTMDAPTESDVNARLNQMGYRPQRVSAAPSTAAPSARTANSPPTPSGISQLVSQAAHPRSTRGAASAKDLALFFRQFASLIRSGITLFQALENLGPRSPNAALASTAKEMAEAAHGGGKISDVMERYPGLYAPHVVATVRSGELGGFLEIVLDEIALDYEQEVAFYKGMWLPRLMIVQEIFAIAIAQPLFPTVFPDGEFGRYVGLVFLRNIPIALLLVFLGRLAYLWMQQPARRGKRDEIALKFPVFGELARVKSLASFVRSLRRLYAAGIGPIGAWEGAMNVAPNSVIRRKLADSYESMRRGAALHEAFTSTGLFANETEQLLATGVFSGQVVDMLDRVADYYQEGVGRAYDKARFWMNRIASAVFLLLVGIMLAILMKTYFAGLFNSPLTQPD